MILSLVLLAVTGLSQAAGTVYTRTVDNMLRDSTCSVPVTREDGTALLISEIAVLDLYVTQDLTQPDPAPHFSDLAVGCAGIVDMTVLADGQWYLYWRTVDTGGRTSGRSATVPFVLQSNTGALPSAPGAPTLN